MERLEVSGAVRPIYGSLGFKRLITQRDVFHRPELRLLIQEHFHNGTTVKLDKIRQFCAIPSTTKFGPHFV